MIDRAMIAKGRAKCRAKNRVSVALLTAKPPHTHFTNVVPMYGIAERMFVITVAPQNDICPQGRTYPRNAVVIVIDKIKVPIVHVSFRMNDPQYVLRPRWMYMHMNISEAPFACTLRISHPLLMFREI